MTVGRTRKRLALLGVGNRGGDVYGEEAARAADLVEVVAVADPRAERLHRAGDRHAVPADGRFASWSALLGAAEAGSLALDAVVVATPDAEHVGPAVRALGLGLDVLLEKPIAPDAAGVDAVARAASASRGRVTVAHVLRHAPVFGLAAGLLRGGAIGELVGVDHVEHVGHWHFAHAYVRGNWRRERDASPMILAKACHDLDLLRWLVGRPCRRVVSFGGLHHFTRASAPEGSTERCTDGCAVEATCPYSAPRIYLGRFGGEARWPNTVLTVDPDPERVRGALASGPYGRCVYRCDNDVADHQVVALDFEGGVRATLTVTAFTEASTRSLRAWGTHGELELRMDAGEILHRDFAGGTTHRHVAASDAGHRLADAALTRDWFERLHDTASAATDLEASLESHALAFAAERSRRGGGVVDLAADAGP